MSGHSLRPMAPSGLLRVFVEDAMDWLRRNPGRDHLDAAYAMANRPGGSIESAQWQEYVAAVADAARADRQAEPEPELEAER